MTCLFFHFYCPAVDCLNILSYVHASINLRFLYYGAIIWCSSEEISFFSSDLTAHSRLIRIHSTNKRYQWLLIFHVIFYSIHEVLWNHSIYWYIRLYDCLVFQWWKPIWPVHSLLTVQKEAVPILNQIVPVVLVGVHHRNNKTVVDTAVHHLSNHVVAGSLHYQAKRQILLGMMVLIKLKQLRGFASDWSAESCFFIHSKPLRRSSPPDLFLHRIVFKYVI